MIKENDNTENVASEPERVLGAKIVRELRDAELKAVYAGKGITGGKNKEPSDGTYTTYKVIDGTYRPVD